MLGRMPRVQRVPEQLKLGPVTIAQAKGLGFDRQLFRGRNWRRVGCGVYVWAALDDEPHGELVALLSRLPAGSVFSGRTAARLHGMETDGSPGVEFTVLPGTSVRSRPGVQVRIGRLHASTVTMCGTLPVTTPVRTCLDLARRVPLAEAVATLDQAVHLGLVALGDLRLYCAEVGRVRGIPRARRAVDLVEPGVESPMESRLRMILVLGGLPRPRVQVEIRDGFAGFLGRPDLLYPEARLGIEYDGGSHRDRLVSDNRRQNRLQKAGFMLLRYTAPDVYGRPEAIVDEVRTLLQARAS